MRELRHHHVSLEGGGDLMEQRPAVVATKSCVVCGEPSTLHLTPEEHEAFLRWSNKELLIQQAFPKWTPAQRELLVSGTHPKCWDTLWAEDES